MLQVEDHLNLLSAQYLVQCLDTENVCHHITKMDHPPREMKETIFTRHNHTVLPLLANNKKDTLQALHTSFVNTDEETFLSRRQRTTLSQLCSCCPDCGMYPHDVPHLFDFMAHPNDLSPVNLWDKQVKTIRELRFLDPGNLD